MTDEQIVEAAKTAEKKTDLLLGGVYSSYDMAKAYVEGQYNILKNLDKYRPSFKPSEEDEKKLNTIIEVLEHEECYKLIDWLKSKMEVFGQ